MEKKTNWALDLLEFTVDGEAGLPHTRILTYPSSRWAAAVASVMGKRCESGPRRPQGSEGSGKAFLFLEEATFQPSSADRGNSTCDYLETRRRLAPKGTEGRQ